MGLNLMNYFCTFMTRKLVCYVHQGSVGKPERIVERKKFMRKIKNGFKFNELFLYAYHDQKVSLPWSSRLCSKYRGEKKI